MDRVEIQIAEWRAFVTRAPAVDGRDLDELESHLRDQIADLQRAGLASDEAFLIAVKRMGSLDELSREFAREHSGRLWRQLVLATDDSGAPPPAPWGQAVIVAVVAAVLAQGARLVAGFPDETPDWLARSASLLALPCLAAYFGWRRGVHRAAWASGAAAFVGAAVLVNAYPYDVDSDTQLLVIAHLPVALWAVVAYAYMAGDARAHERRMDFVRFTGEFVIYYVLIALGGGVLMALTALILEPAEPGLAEAVFEWMVPSGAAGAVVVAAWLVESKQRVVENMAPVLTMLFTPLFAAVLVCATVVHLFTGFDGVFDRELLGVFDALMVVVLGLVLYGMSARDASPLPNWMDRIQLVAVVSALVLDALVLGSMVVRIGELGLTPNRVAALGLNLTLLVNLAVHARLAVAFVRGTTPFHRLERWQTAYLPVFAAWTAAVVILLPPAFAFA